MQSKNILKQCIFQAVSIAVLVFALFSSPVSASENPDHIIVQLHWKHQFSTAGLYAAKEKGFYAAEGLDVEFVTNAAGLVPVKEVVTGRAQYGLAASEVLLARLRGEPVVALAALMQHSAAALLVREDSEIYSPQQLVGKTIEIDLPETDAEIYAMLLSEGVRPGMFKRRRYSFSADNLIHGEVDALSAYVTNQPFFLAREGIGYRLLRPSTYGVDFYGLTLFTSEEEIVSHPERVKAFRRATLRGWEYAFEHPHELIDIILTKYVEPDSPETRDHLFYEYEQLRRLCLPSLVELGHMNPGRWRQIAETLVRLGLCKDTRHLKGFIYTPQKSAFYWTHWAVRAGIGAVIGISALAALLYLFNRRLSREISRRNKTEQRLHRVLWGANLGYWDLNHKTGELYVGPHTAELLGMRPNDMPRRLDFTSQARMGGGFFAELKRNFAENRDAFDFEYELKSLKERPKWILCRGRVFARDRAGNPLRSSGTLIDISASKEHQRELEIISITDPLTGLYNRRHFFDHLGPQMDRARRSGSPLSVVILDIDYFKEVNDRHGHLAGDAILKEFAAALQARIRPYDILARYGGEEFVIMLPDTGRAHAQEVVERLRRDVTARAFPIPGGAVGLTFSCGIADTLEESGASLNPDSLIARADERLLRAKKSGRNRTVAD